MNLAEVELEGREEETGRSTHQGWVALRRELGDHAVQLCAAGRTGELTAPEVYRGRWNATE